MILLVNWRCQRLLAVAAVCLCLMACGASEAPEADQSFESAPAFTLPLLGGGEVSLADFAGRPVVIDFWATWCAPCVKQVPMFNAFHAEFGDQVTFLAIATDAKGAEVVAPFADEHEIAYPVLLGDEAMAMEWNLFGYPSLFVIDPEGNIRESHVGPLPVEDLHGAVAEWVDPGA